MPLSLGRLTLHEVRDGSFSLDGGAMFGIVPRPIWEKSFSPDAQNRIALSVRCLLIDDGNRKILVDDGLGSKWSERHREMYAIDQRHFNMDSELARAGTNREAITDVILTHLHFDHAGGTTVRRPDGALALGFPNATFHLQRRNWKWAHQPSEKDSGSYLRENFDLLEESGALHLIEGETELYEGVHLFLSEGHTVGLQLVRVESQDQSVVTCGDLVPTRAHLKPHYAMSYDLYPLTVIEEKKMLLAQAHEEGWILFFEHDPRVAACRLQEQDGKVVAGEVVSL
jgi:glyoxylase-like metal-dependent hydrolase (beta-lactamase superfamily II)